jgi:hypothetical protein
MKPKRHERNEGSLSQLQSALEHGLHIELYPNGEVGVVCHPQGRVIVFTSELKLGKWLAALIVDGGFGYWKLRKEWSLPPGVAGTPP